MFFISLQKVLIDSWWETLILGIMSVAFCYWFDLSGEDLEYWCGLLWMIDITPTEISNVGRGQGGQEPE